MSSTAQLLDQRATGHVKLHFGAGGVVRLREQGSAKIRIPPKSNEAILINTAGGLAGGDEVWVDLGVESGAKLCVTSQSAERVYRTIGPSASVHLEISVAAQGNLQWLPRETILFDGSSLDRTINVKLATSARFLGLESVVFGREHSGETISALKYSENWRIEREAKLCHAERFVSDGALPRSKATLANAGAIATLILVDKNVENMAERVLPAIGKNGGVSAWNGKMVARLHAADGFQLRKVLNSVLCEIVGKTHLPKTWNI